MKKSKRKRLPGISLCLALREVEHKNKNEHKITIIIGELPTFAK